MPIVHSLKHRVPRQGVVAAADAYKGRSISTKHPSVVYFDAAQGGQYAAEVVCNAREALAGHLEPADACATLNAYTATVEVNIRETLQQLAAQDAVQVQGYSASVSVDVRDISKELGTQYSAAKGGSYATSVSVGVREALVEATFGSQQYAACKGGQYTATVTVNVT